LTLASRTVDAGVSNEGLEGMANTKDCDEDISGFLNNLVSGLTSARVCGMRVITANRVVPPTVRVGK
jgi:hypothetical protein